MGIKQLSVFLENEPGSLERVAYTLKENHINMDSFSLADSSEYGVFRIIVSNPELGLKVLKEEGFSAMLTDVLAINIAQEPGTLQKVLGILSEEKISVEYMYTLCTSGKNTSIIMKLSDVNKGGELLKSKGYTIIES